MGLGLQLRATVRDRDPLSTLERFLRDRYDEHLERLERDDHSLNVQLHPASEDVEFGLENGVVVVSAKTSTVGPGYHAFLCDLLKQLGWDWVEADEYEGDETGYFVSGDRDALEREFLAWLTGLAKLLVARLDEGATQFMISLPTNVRFELGDGIATPMGPRDRAWLERVVRDARSGIDLFPWWEPGVGAHFHRGRALARMWTDVRFRAPLTDEETELLESIDEDLATALEIDPSIDLPWAEWAEIQEFLEVEPTARARAAGRAPTIGYRRRPVTVSISAGWSVKIPGEFATEVDAEGTWSGWVPGRTLWVSSFRIGDPDQPTLTAAETLPTRTPEGTPVRIDGMNEELAYRASLSKTSEGDTQLSLEVAKPHRLALFTFVLDNPTHLDWAKSVAATIQ